MVNPLRIQILEAFAGPPRTTKQVADALGVPPTRLYRHVEALKRAGLLLPRGEKQKRGTTEKYLQAVARRIEVDATVFAPAGTRGSLRELMHPLFDDARRKAVRAVSRARDAGDPGDHELAPLVAKASIRATAAEIKRLRRQLAAWIHSCEALQARRGRAATRQYQALIAFYSTE
jgi:predicted transcriptional regulator